MVPRDIPFLLEEERLPAAIASCGESAEPESLEDVAAAAAAERLEPLDRCHVTCPEALLSADEGYAEVQTASGRNVVLGAGLRPDGLRLSPPGRWMGPPAPSSTSPTRSGWPMGSSS